MVPSPPSQEELLALLQAAVFGEGAERAAARRGVPQTMNRPGAAQLLMQILRTGNPSQTQLAGYGLGHARSELVRRQLRLLAKELSGDRRLSCLAALTHEELGRHLEEQGEAARAQLISSSSVLALNRPADFIDLVCEGLTIVDLPTVEEIEAMRQRYAIGAVSMYDPLLQRPLAPQALTRAARILGTEPGADVRVLLRKALSRARDDAARKVLRREQLRQASHGITARNGSVRAGAALLRPIAADSQGSLEIFERVPSGELVQTTVTWPLRARPEFVSVPLDAPLEDHLSREYSRERDASLTLGQARMLLESFRDVHQSGVAPVLARLADVPPESVPIPPPGDCLSQEQARALLLQPLWAEWRPFETVAALTRGDESSFIKAQFERRAGAAWLAEGLRHMALVMHLRGDPLAPSVVAEAIWAARKRASPLVQALARMERERSLAGPAACR